MRTSEIVIVSYFGYVAVAALVVRVPWRARAVAMSGAASMYLVSVGAAQATGPWVVLRDWFPALCVAIGYWLPRALVSGINPVQEAWLVRSDRRLLGWAPVRRLLEQLNRGARQAFELSYLLAYPIVPAGALVAWSSGGSVASDRYWAVVLTAAFAAYGMLPWIATRTPRALEGVAPSLPLQAANHRVLRLVSHELNTVPSGHASATIAAALALSATSVAVSALFGALAVGIAAGAVLGRYHFVVDVISGLLLGLIAWILLGRV